MIIRQMNNRQLRKQQYRMSEKENQQNQDECRNCSVEPNDKEIKQNESPLSQQKSTFVKKIQFYSNNDNLMSPLEKDHPNPKDFSTPIQIAEFSQNHKYQLQYLNDDSNSPMINIELSNDIMDIAEKDNEDEEEGGMGLSGQEREDQLDMVTDLMGNRICEFNVTGNDHVEEDDQQLSPIVEDKENDRPEKYLNLNTPLKIRHPQLRSPLQDITPSMTHKKKIDPFDTKTNKKNKTSNKTANKAFGMEFQKWGLLTPRTMAQSRLQKGKTGTLNTSKLKIQRF